MTSQRSSFRAVAAVLAALVPIVAAATFVYWGFINSRQAYLTGKRYRVLANIGDDLNESVQALATAYDTAFETFKNAPCKVPPNGKRPPLEEAVPELECVTEVPDAVRIGEWMNLDVVNTIDGWFLYVGRQDQIARTPLATLVSRAAGTDQLSDVLVTTADGRVLYQRDGLPVKNLNDLIEHPPAKTGSTDATDQDKRDAAHKRDERLVGLQTVTLQNARYLLFVVPLSLRAKFKPAPGQEAEDIDLRLCGLLPEKRLTQQAHAVPLTWLFVLLLVLALTILSWPMLKLWYVGPRERFEGVEAKALVLSAVLATGVQTLVLGVAPGYRGLTVAFDGQLQELAGRLVGRFTGELRSAYEVLSSAFVDDEPDMALFHDYNDLTLIGLDGKAVAHWMPQARLDEARAVAWDAKPTPMELNLGDRLYFRKARQRQYWGVDLKFAANEPSRGFTVETVRSRRSGQPSLVLATAAPGRPPAGQPVPACVDEPRHAAAVGVIAMASTVLDHAVVPEGFSIAVVDVAGGAMLQSDARRSARENVFDECDHDAALTNAVRARRSQLLNVTCYGESQRLYTAPIQSTPWSVIVFRSNALLDGVTAELVVAWLAWFLVYSGLFLGCLAIVQLVDPDYRARWIWPCRAHAGPYVAAAARLAITAAVAAMYVPELESVPKGLATLAVPAVAVALLCLNLDPAKGERAIARAVALVGGLALMGLAYGHGLRAVLAVVSIGTLWSFELLRDRWGERAAATAAAGATAMLALSLVEPPPPWIGTTVAATAATAAAVGGSLPTWLDGVGTSLRARVVAWGRGDVAFRASYVAMLSGLLLVLGVLPSWVYYRDAREYAMTVLLKHGQEEFTGAMMERSKRIREETAKAYEDDPELADAVVVERLDGEREVYRGSWLTWPAAGLGIDAHPEFASCMPVPTWMDDTPFATREHACDAPAVPSRSLTYPLLRFLPTYSPLSAGLRGAACAGASDGAWCWAPSGSSIDLVVQQEGLSHFLGTSHPLASPRRDPTPDGPAPVAWRPALAAAFVFVTALLAMGLIWSVSRLVFLLDADGGAAAGPAGRRVFVYTRHGEEEASALLGDGPDTDVVDLRLARPAGPAWDEPDGWRKEVEIDHLEELLDDPPRAAAVRGLIGMLVAEGRRVVLSSEVDPLESLTEAEEDDPRPAPAAAPKGDKGDKTGPAPVADPAMERRAWSALLASFVRAPVRVAPDGAPLLRARYAGEAVVPELDDEANDDRLHGRNACIWSGCTPGERLALRQVAEEGFLNPRDTNMARRLLRRGLVRRDRAFELLDPSFRRFVLRAMPAHEVAALEDDARTSSWSRVRAPLLVLLILAAAFVFYTQRDTFNSAIGLATALGGALPLVLRVLTLTADDKSGATARA